MRATCQRRIVIAGLAGALAICCADGYAQSTYNLQVIRPFFIPGALNSQGQVVGLTLNEGGFGQGAIWRRSDTRIVTLGKTYDAAADINSAGQVAGTRNLGPEHYQATVFSNGGYRDLGTLGGNSSFARAINASGQVTGVASTASGQDHAFVTANGKMVDLGTLGGWQSSGADINDSGQVVGSASVTAGDGAPRHAFLYSGGRMIDLGTFGGMGSAATSINDAGQVVGNVNMADGTMHGFFYENGTATEIVGPAGGSLSPRSINQNGDVVGDAWTLDSRFYGFIYTDGKLSSLSALLNTREGWEVYEAAGIDDAGNIAGWGCRPHPQGSGLDCAGMFLSPVPEPVTWTLWTAGLLFGWMARRKRRG